MQINIWRNFVPHILIMGQGTNDHVAKPIEISKLLETLEKWIR